MLTYIGQFISHDIDSRLEGTDEQEDILVPECDEFYDVACTSTQTLPFYRSGFNSTISSKRDQVIDGSYESRMEKVHKCIGILLRYGCV